MLAALVQLVSLSDVVKFCVRGLEQSKSVKSSISYLWAADKIQTAIPKNAVDNLLARGFFFLDFSLPFRTFIFSRLRYEQHISPS